MIRWLRDFRLIPFVLVAVIGLFTLKSFGILLEGGYTFGFLPHSRKAPTPSQPATVVASRPTTERHLATTREPLDSPSVTGSVAASKPAPAKKEADPTKAAADDKAADPQMATETKIPIDVQRLSPAERAILERLQERHKELDTRAKDLDMRENLIKAAEKRLEERVNQLKQLEQKVKTSMGKRDEDEVARFNNLVTMYENMKAKDAAKIFDKLDRTVLIEVASKINPRQMAEILAQMETAAAEQLTVELANRSANPGQPKTSPAQLPKIQGQPTAN